MLELIATAHAVSAQPFAVDSDSWGCEQHISCDIPRTRCKSVQFLKSNRTAG